MLLRLCLRVHEDLLSLYGSNYFFRFQHHNSTWPSYSQSARTTFHILTSFLLLFVITLGVIELRISKKEPKDYQALPSL